MAEQPLTQKIAAEGRWGKRGPAATTEHVASEYEFGAMLFRCVFVCSLVPSKLEQRGLASISGDTSLRLFQAVSVWQADSSSGTQLSQIPVREVVCGSPGFLVVVSWSNW